MANKSSGTVRTTISIPAKLKRRMDEVTEPINWSALAAEAFQDKLAAIAAQKKEGVMTNVLERLRASKRKSESADYQNGYALGKEWAEQSAEASELQRLEELHDKLVDQPQFDWDDYFNEGGSAYSTDERLYFEINPDDDSDRKAADDFWECAAGDALQKAANKSAFLKGFAEGAIDLWLTVKNEL
jgi:hypothetical protein